LDGYHARIYVLFTQTMKAKCFTSEYNAADVTTFAASSVVGQKVGAAESCNFSTDKTDY